MTQDLLRAFSDQLADAVQTIAASVVQVYVRRQPVSGVVYAPGTVITTGRALARDSGVRVRPPEGEPLAAEVAGWDPATHLAVLKVPDLSMAPATVAARPARVGHLGLAVARSWSNAVTATAGNVAVIGGPLSTGRGRIEQIIRTTAPMHLGFAGGAFADTSGHLVGVATATEIRGLGVVIPAGIAWKAAADVLEHGHVKRAYLGLAGQTVQLTAAQRGDDGPETALLVVGLVPGGPAEQAGLLVGDLLVSFDGVPVDSPERLLEALATGRAGRTVTTRIIRGGAPAEVVVVVGEREPR